MTTSLGRIVRYVGLKGEICPAMVTNTFPNNRVNLQLFRDGVNQAHLPEYVYTVDHAPLHPTTGGEPNTWHWPETV